MEDDVRLAWHVGILSRWSSRRPPRFADFLPRRERLRQSAGPRRSDDLWKMVLTLNALSGGAPAPQKHAQEST